MAIVIYTVTGTAMMTGSNFSASRRWALRRATSPLNFKTLSRSMDTQ